MSKTYNKKANPARVEQFNAVDLDCSIATVTGVQAQSEIQGLCDSLDKQITTLCEKLGYLETRLTPVLKSSPADFDTDEETTNWGNIIKTVEIDNSCTPIGQYLEAQCARLAAAIEGVNLLTERLGI